MPVSYMFNGLSGKLVSGQAQTVYNPQAFKPAERMQFVKSSATDKLSHVRTLADARSGGGHQQLTVPQNRILGKIPDTEQYRKIMEFQRVMQRQDGKMVWQKFGRDLAAYRFTVGLCLVSVAYMAGTMYNMAMPKKEE